MILCDQSFNFFGRGGYKWFKPIGDLPQFADEMFNIRFRLRRIIFNQRKWFRFLNKLVAHFDFLPNEVESVIKFVMTQKIRQFPR